MLEDEPWVCVHTAPSGKYALTVAQAGEFTVEVSTPQGARYVSREIYGGASFRELAAHVPVREGRKKGNVNITIGEGGRISGTVTSGSTHDPVSELEVCTPPSNTKGAAKRSTSA